MKFHQILISMVIGFIIGFSLATDGSKEAVGQGRPFTVTAYCPCELCCGIWADGHFANGEEVSFPALAAPPEIPFGTRIYVPGYGVAEVKDRGGAIKGDKLDVYFSTHQQALEWGVQELRVKIAK